MIRSGLNPTHMNALVNASGAKDSDPAIVRRCVELGCDVNHQGYPKGMFFGACACCRSPDVSTHCGNELHTHLMTCGSFLHDILPARLDFSRCASELELRERERCASSRVTLEISRFFFFKF